MEHSRRPDGRTVTRSVIRKHQVYPLICTLGCAGFIGCGDPASPSLPTDFVFDIHFVVLTENLAAIGRATTTQLRDEVRILNEFFVTEDRQPIVTFQFKSATLSDQAAQTTCTLVDVIDLAMDIRSVDWLGAFNGCDDRTMRDPNAINFYVIDSWSADRSFSETLSLASRNNHRPFLMLDWARLGHAPGNGEEHEMGHAFGLRHLCVPGATDQTDSNIMAGLEPPWDPPEPQGDCPTDQEGRRNMGFDNRQVEVIIASAVIIESVLLGGTE